MYVGKSTVVYRSSITLITSVLEVFGLTFSICLSLLLWNDCVYSKLLSADCSALLYYVYEFQ